MRPYTAPDDSTITALRTAPRRSFTPRTERSDDPSHASKEARMTPTTHPRRIAAATLALLALAAPAATAQPIMDGRMNVRGEPAPAPHVRTADESFDWGSAGIGAAATAGLVLVAAGGFAAAHRARTTLAP
jgi:hypothetical protein